MELHCQLMVSLFSFVVNRRNSSSCTTETFMDIDIELSSTRFKKNDNSDNLTVALKLNPNMMVMTCAGMCVLDILLYLRVWACTCMGMHV